MRGALLFFSACALVAGAALECNSDQFCDADAQTCDAQADAPSVPPVSGGGCDSSKPASQGGCSVAESDGFFVSPSGSDSAAGSKAAPFKTIGKGIAAAAADATRPNVYVCQGTYAENLVIQTAPAGVALHGGFDCAEWTQSSAPTAVAPPSGYALHVLGAAALVESMTLTAPDATDPGGSSIGAFVDGSPGMTFRRAAVTGGKAMAGAAAAASPAQLAAATAGSTGGAQHLAASVSCACGTDTTTGGQGAGTANALPPVDAGAGTPVVNGDLTKGLPGANATGGAACIGGKGADGIAGKTGASTGSLGELTANGWAASGGGAGDPGGVAQGGGGGGFGPGSPIDCGGGGACGGCGGAGGAPGGGGGASLAIASLNSTLRVQASTIRAGQGGAGADGAAGQIGQPGGAAGPGGSCAGGGGGTGGNGGAGGGGAGGISVAIATNQGSPKPDVDSVSTVLAGTPGQGGHDGSAAQTKAIDGIADILHSF